MRCLGNDALLVVVGALVRRHCRSAVLAGFASQFVAVPSDRSGNFSETESEPDVPASKIQIFDGIVVEKLPKLFYTSN